MLKIIKHCQDHLLESVTGQLLGLAIGATLEVTHCFPFYSPSDQEEESDAAIAEYLLVMMKHLRTVNVDNNVVGWYLSAYPGPFLNESTIDTQYNYQATIKKCAMIVFDPVKTSQGILSIRAYRLTEPFMEQYKQPNRFTKESLDAANFTFEDIFDEIPVRIHNPHLINALLYDMQGSDLVSAHFERLNLSVAPFLEKNLEFLSESLDDLVAEQNKFQYYQKSLQKKAYLQKKKAEGGEEEDDAQASKSVPQPSRLESLLITSQINKYCEQINKFAGTSFTKLFLYGGMQK